MLSPRSVFQSRFGNAYAFFATISANRGLALSNQKNTLRFYLHTMKKLLIILGSLFALLVIGIFVISFFLGPIITKGVNTFGPKITGTKVTLDHVSVSPLTGSFTMSGLFVGNPEGWKGDKAFYMSKVHVSVAPLSVLGDHIIVKEVLINGPEFVYETNVMNSNIKDLLKNIEKATGGGTTDKPAETSPTTKSGKPIKFEVKNFRLQNAKVTLGVGAAAATLPMPPITLTDLGTQEGGITPDQLAGKVITNILGGIVSAVTHSVGQIGSGATDAASGAIKGIKNLFGGSK